jgi:hypothetical protein
VARFPVNNLPFFPTAFLKLAARGVVPLFAKVCVVVKAMDFSGSLGFHQPLCDAERERIRELSRFVLVMFLPPISC